MKINATAAAILVANLAALAAVAVFSHGNQGAIAIGALAATLTALAPALVEKSRRPDTK